MLTALVDVAKQGDEEAFGALVRSVGDRCMAIAYRILRDVDLAEDAVQTALISAWRELPTLVTRTGSSRGSTGCWSTPATPRPGGASVGR